VQRQPVQRQPHAVTTPSVHRQPVNDTAAITDTCGFNNSIDNPISSVIQCWDLDIETKAKENTACVRDGCAKKNLMSQEGLDGEMLTS